MLLGIIILLICFITKKEHFVNTYISNTLPYNHNFRTILDTVLGDVNDRYNVNYTTGTIERIDIDESNNDYINLNAVAFIYEVYRKITLKVLFDINLDKQANITINNITRINALPQLERGQDTDRNSNLYKTNLGEYTGYNESSLNYTLFDEKNKESFLDKIRTINKQVKLIEKLVNEFSDFARMPKPILKKNNLILILTENIKLLNELDKSIKIKFIKNQENVFFECDKEQLGRGFFNLIKNSIESIHQKADNMPDLEKKISIEILSNYDHIKIILIDNGVGFDNFSNNLKDILNPYFTTKKNGTGLGLSIVNKIINDHNGNIKFIPIQDGAKIEINFYINGNRNTDS